jgi:hypothetical protein
MEANVEYTLQRNANGQPRVCLVVKLPAEVIGALAEGSNASICINTPKGVLFVLLSPFVWQNVRQ